MLRLIFLLAVWPMAVYAATAEQVGPAKATGAEATFKVANREVAVFRTLFNGADPQARVARAQSRLAEAHRRELTGNIELASFVVENRRAFALRAGDVVLFHIAEGDLEPGAGLELEAAARSARERLTTALALQDEASRIAVLTRGVAAALAATLALALALWLLWRGAMALARRVGNRPAPGGPANLLQYASTVIERLLQLSAFFLSAGLVFLWLEAILYAFPPTRPLAEGLGQVLGGALKEVGRGTVDAIPGLIVVAVIVLLAQALNEASNAVFRAIARGTLSIPRMHQETASATRRLVAMAIWACALVAAYPYLPGSNSDIFKGLSVLIGAMVTLGSTGIMNQIMSGLVLVYSRALRAGDYVVVGDQEGVVTEVGTLATKIVTMRNEEITIPNAALVGNSIKNYSKLSDAQGTMISTRVTIGYDAPWRQVHALLAEAAGNTAGLRSKPAPFVLQRALSDFYVEYELFVNIDKPLERLPTLSSLHGAIQDSFNAAGVQIMSPHFLSQPDAPVVVARENWQVRPSDSGGS